MNLFTLVNEGKEMKVEAGPLLWILIFAWIVVMALRFHQASSRMRVSKVKVKFPFDIGEVELEVDERERQAAWSLYIELMTRISTQPLEPGSGSDKVALNSLYALYGTSRELLKSAPPATQGENLSFGEVAIKMLNGSLRAFLAKWHIQLEGDQLPSAQHEVFRTELAALQRDLRLTADNLAILAKRS
ncbi:hypothetical protein [Fimbriimonas ginsengisoli]|uniref:Putative membrane protein n=1 Tax=Fimbriimonas ginsengisoli Gsoil 348 TaxID=661478 RepID=A0A068NLW5_FIMGI|nr:hypothetical protein [Fimbriimonas ginsengisoli]AIE83765.1 putative membrane protein [Fimbriimonas ginsengisoli Gsoil 348]